MNLVSPLSLLFGLVVSAPALVEVYDDPSADVTTALLHFVVATLVAGMALRALRGIVLHYARGGGRRRPAAATPTQPAAGRAAASAVIGGGEPRA